MKTNTELDLERLPKHIAFIIDGNGRWAKERSLPRSMGHKAGMQTLGKTMQHAFELGIQVVSVYAFSTENWNRPQDEVDYLMKLFRDFVNKDMDKWLKKGIRLNVMGDISRFPDDLQKAIIEAKEKTRDNTEKVFNLGINYGSRDEILRAVNNIVDANEKNVTADVFEKYLYTAELPPLDYIIRTSGEQRLSNFMLWQCAYSEFYFPKTYWPDFDEKELEMALVEYQRRDRRFGAIKK